jgi:exodeoxyribonuclease VII small subunit
MAKTTDSFEKDLQNLEKLVEKLEQGEMPLEDALEQFERGIALTRRCQQALQAAEQKIQILLKKNADATPSDFDTGDNKTEHDHS